MDVIKQKIPISVVMITLNEQNNIVRALKSVEWADDVVVYDSGSTDETPSIAKKMGARVVEGAWLGFGETKRKATEFAKYDWIFSLDADEEVTHQLEAEIRKNLSVLDPQVAYRVPRLSEFLNRKIRHGGWYPDFQIRLFNRKFSNWNSSEIHEKVIAIKHQKLISSINHYVFRDIEHQVSTNNRYSGLLAKELFKKGRRFSWFHFLTKPCFKFFECYFLKLGFLDGWPGFVIAKNAAYSVFLKWSKMKELEMRA